MFTIPVALFQKSLIAQAVEAISAAYGVWDGVNKDTTIAFTAGTGNRGITRPSNATGNTWVSAMGSSATVKTSGKWYYEVTITAIGNGLVTGFGNTTTSTTTTFVGSNTNAGGWINTGVISNPGGTTIASYTTGDTIGVALDVTAKTVSYYKKSGSSMVLQVTQSWGPNVTGTAFQPIISMAVGSTIVANFGNAPFVQLPAGYNAGFYSPFTWGNAGNNWTLSNGSLTATHATTTPNAIRSISEKVSGSGNGKYYVEVTVGTIGAGANELTIGVCSPATNLNAYPGTDGSCHSWYNSGSVLFSNAGAGSAGTYTTGDKIGVALDITPATRSSNGNAGRIGWYKNGTLMHTTNSHTSTSYFLIMGSDRTGSGTVNFTPTFLPAGYVAWSTA